MNSVLPHRRPVYLAASVALLATVAGGISTAVDSPLGPQISAAAGAAEGVEAISFPSPDEYFSALAKSTNPRWRKWYREIEQQPPTERSKIAAGLGMLVAEAHLSSMARDEQRLRNICGEIAAFAKVLGLSETAATHLAAVEAAATRGSWPEAQLALEQLLSGFAGKLLEQRDGDLARLAQIGLWMRVLQVGAGVVQEGHVKDLSLAVGGEGMPQRVALIASGLSERSRETEDVAFMLRQCDKICRVWSAEKFQSGREFTMEEVSDCHERLTGIIAHLSKR